MVVCLGWSISAFLPHNNGLLKIIKIWSLQNDLAREVVFGPFNAGDVSTVVDIRVRYL
jgi:hypothetical protein